MDEKNVYSPQEIAVMFQKTSELEAAIGRGETREICQKIAEYRLNVPERVRHTQWLLSGDNYIERRATDLVAR